MNKRQDYIRSCFILSVANGQDGIVRVSFLPLYDKVNRVDRLSKQSAGWVIQKKIKKIN